MRPTVEFLNPRKSICVVIKKWSREFKARLISETLRPSARFVDVAQCYGTRANRLCGLQSVGPNRQLAYC